MNAIDFECPVCGAKPGERCHTATGKANPVSHSRRKQAALALPYLIADGDLPRCSVCGYTFSAEVEPSIHAAFAEHLNRVHEPGQMTEDFDQAAARIVRETTKN